MSAVVVQLPTQQTTAWAREALVPYLDLPPETPDIAGLFYPGRRHLVSGPGEAHKTWLVLAAAASELEAGRGVIWADLDGMGAREIASRLIALGVSREQIDTLVYFTFPDGPLGEVDVAALLEWSKAATCRLLVSDAFTGFLRLHNLDGNDNIDVETAWVKFDQFNAAGIAVVLIDHVVKNPEQRNGQAIGSERKGTAAWLHFDLSALEKLQRGGIGRSKIGVSRDRGAYFPRPAGTLVLNSDADTGAVTWRIDKTQPHAAGFRPTNLMEKVSTFVENSSEPPSRNMIERGVKGDTNAKRLAIDILADEGYIDENPGPRSGRCYRTLKPYRESHDLAATSLDLAGSDVTTTSLLAALPIGSSEVSDSEPATQLTTTSLDDQEFDDDIPF